MKQLVIIFLLFFAGPAASQVVDTQTGEHADFTRVVLRIPPASEWSIGRLDAGYGVVIEDVASFDLDGFFELIPRDRIESAEVTDDGILYLALACVCNVVASRDSPRILVIDVYDGEPDADSPFEMVLGGDVSEPEVVISPEDDIAIPAPRLDLALLPEFPTPSLFASTPAIPTEDSLRALSNERTALSDLEIAVTESLSRAATQGLLELRDDLKAPEAEKEADPPVAVPEVLVEAPAPAGAPRPGIIANTSVDLSLSGLFDAQELTSELQSCWPERLVDVPSWGTEEDFGDQLASLRGAVTAEFDAVDPQAVESLARFYVYFGFGREAIQTLGIDGINSRERAAITSLAQIVDGDPVTDTALSAQALCPNPVALWSLLASTNGPPPAAIDTQMIARAFKLLPLGLQRHLGPRFAERMIAMKQPDMAEIFLTQSVDALEPPVDTAIVSSALAAERGELRSATNTLAELTENETRATPESVISLITLKIEQNQPIGGETLSLAETMKFEFSGAPIALDLAEAVIRAHISNGDLDIADAELHRQSALFSDATLATLDTLIVERSTDESDDVTFVDLIFAHPLASVEPELGNAVAKRLLDIGFPDRANEILSTPAIGAAMNERRYLRAQAAVNMGDFELAEAHLAGIDTPRAAELLSFGPEGVPLAGLSDDQSDGTGTNDAISDWRNGNWDSLADSDDPLLRDVSGLVLSEQTEDVNPETPLANSRALVDAASQTRETLDALIARFDAPLLEDQP